MAKVKILFISFLLFGSWAKPIKESTIDNENTNHAIKVTLSGLENDEGSIYIRKDDILSISEISKLYNPGERHINDLHFIKENGSTYDKNLRSRDNETKSEIPELEKFKENNQTERNVDATTMDSREPISNKESRSEEFSTDTNENESTTISVIGQGKSGEIIERDKDNLEVPENFEPTEEYSKTAASNDETNSTDEPEDIESQFTLRRSIFQNDQVPLDSKEIADKTPVEILLVDHDNLTTSEISSLEKSDEQSEIKKESKESEPEELSSETYGFESTTISIEDQAKTDELTEDEDDLEVTENYELTEGDFKTAVSKDDTNNDNLDDIVQPIQTRRSIFQNDRLLFHYNGEISKKPIVIVEDYEDTVPKLETVSLKKYIQQSKIGSDAETPSVGQERIDPYPLTSQKHFHNLSPHLSFRRIIPADLSKISHEESTDFELLTMGPDEYKQSNNLDRSDEVWSNERTIKELNSNNYKNAYPYVSSTVNSPNQELSINDPKFNSVYLKLSKASEHPLRIGETGEVKLGDAEIPSMSPQVKHLSPVTSYQQYHNLPPHLSLRSTDPADLRKTSNEESTNFGLVEVIPDVKQSNNLGRSEEVWKNEKGIEKSHTNIHDNAFEHTYSNVRSEKELPKEPNFSSFYSKLNQVSEHPLRDRTLSLTGGVSLGNYGEIHPYHNLRNYPKIIGPISRRIFVRH